MPSSTALLLASSSTPSTTSAAVLLPPPVHPIVHFFAGWLGASLSCVLLSPLEVIKTRQQSAACGLRRGVRADTLAREIWAAEGARGFYRGLIPHLLGVGPARAFYFGGYAYAKRELGGPGGLTGPKLHLTAAALASIVSSSIMCPVWVIKVRLQLAGAPCGGEGGLTQQRPYKGVVDAFRRVYAEEGIGAFYRGLSASYLGVAETALQFALYGELKDYVIQSRRNAAAIASANAAAAHLPPPPPTPDYPDSIAFWTSAAAKLVAAVGTYPHEVLRTRMREKGGSERYSGIIVTTRRILAEEGVRGLYGGMAVHLLRTVPNAAILLMVVEKATGGKL